MYINIKKCEIKKSVKWPKFKQKGEKGTNRKRIKNTVEWNKTHLTQVRI